MAITLTQERKKQKYLLLILVLVFFVTIFIVWFGFFNKKEAAPPIVEPVIIYNLPEVEINWRMLEDLKNESLQQFEEISSFEGDFGRSNPFIPY